MIPTAEAGYETGMRRFIGPQMYQHNSFRLADLDITASGRAVRRRAEEMRGDEQIAEACRQLGDPMRRIIDEFFWHWPGYDAHNRAVDAHAKALADPADEVDWAGVRLRWHEAAGDEAGWDYVHDRILQLDEPEIRPDFVDQLRRLLPTLLVSVNAALFARAIERGDESAAANQMRATVQMASADERLAGAEIARAIQPVLDDIRRRAAAAQDEVTVDHRRGLVIAQQLIAQAEHLARVIGKAPGRAKVATLCDEIAATARWCIAAYGNETGAASSCARLLAQARSLTSNAVAIRDIDVDRGTFLSNELRTLCDEMRAPVDGRPDHELRDVATLLDSAEDVLYLLAEIPSMPPEEFDESCDNVVLAIVTAVSMRLTAMCDSRRADALLRRAEALAATGDTRFLIGAARMAATIGHELRQCCWFCGQLSSLESVARVRLVRRRTLTEQVVDIERCPSCQRAWNRISPILGAMNLIMLTMLLALVTIVPVLGLLGVIGSGVYIPALGVFAVAYAGTWIAGGRARGIDARMREHPAVARELMDARVLAVMEVRK
ncbi:hypothetical protein OIE68_13410 [Nocardia vinacea]|uniref:Uncharacterized protein n=1 Tax=Nocardia vinacea TaxID=96468 RepID=A0ABZ1YU23_9NOCA|nr:hypothetical protein OIE68_13410 [Nocardia vinacea]